MWPIYIYMYTIIYMPIGVKIKSIQTSEIGMQWNSTYPNAGYLDDQLSRSPQLSVKFVNNSTKLTCLEITGYRIKYSTVLWLLKLQIRRGRKVQTQVHTVNSNSRPYNCVCSLFSKKSPIIRIFCLSGWLAVPVNPCK